MGPFQFYYDNLLVCAHDALGNIYQYSFEVLNSAHVET